MERRSADSPNPDIRDEGAVTNAQGDPSWARLTPHPENARPPPYLDPPQQQFEPAPAEMDWAQELEQHDYSIRTQPSFRESLISRQSCGGDSANASVNACGQNSRVTVAHIGAQGQ